jgi:parvulin-like peptidyl-prolyl isomerase
MKKVFKLLITGLIIGSVFSGCKATEDFVATVNNQKITKDEYKYFLMVIKSNMEQMAGASDKKSKKSLWEGNISGKNAEQYAKELALENAKEFEILLESAAAAGYKIDEKEIETANTQINTYVESLGEGKEGVKKYEETYGMSMDLLKSINKDLLLVQKYYENEVKKIQNTDEEIKKYYEEFRYNYEQATVRQVVFMTIDQNTDEPLSQAKQDSARKNAENILARVKAGEDIATLAKLCSEDQASKANGGQYSFLKGDMVQELENWAFSAKAGEIDLVKTEYGYHVIKLEKMLGFEDVKETVNSDLRSKKYNEQIQALKNASKYELKKNDRVYNKIKIS